MSALVTVITFLLLPYLPLKTSCFWTIFLAFVTMHGTGSLLYNKLVLTVNSKEKVISFLSLKFPLKFLLFGGDYIISKFMLI